MSENETKKEEEFDTKRARRACSITFLVLILIFVAPILTLYLLILHACHQEPDLSDYHLIGETVVLSGEKFDYQITYESIHEKYDPEFREDVKSVKLSISINKEIEKPNVLHFYTKTSFAYIYSNGNKCEMRQLSYIFGPRYQIDVPVETNPCEVEICYGSDNFKGYVKFGLIDVRTDDNTRVEAIEIDLY